MASTPRIEVSDPKVTRRVYKVQYATPPQQQPPSGSRARGSKRLGAGDGSGGFDRKMSMKAYDRSTDNDIFALGSAFKSGNFDIDEFLQSFKNSNTVIQEGVDSEGNNANTVSSFESSANGNELVEFSASPKKSSMITTMVGPTMVTRKRRIITTIVKSSDNDGNPVVSQQTMQQVVMPDGSVINESETNLPAITQSGEGVDESYPQGENVMLIEPNQEQKDQGAYNSTKPTPEIKKPVNRSSSKDKQGKQMANLHTISEDEDKESDDTDTDADQRTISNNTSALTTNSTTSPATTMKFDIEPVVIDVEGKVLDSSDEDEEIQPNIIQSCPFFTRRIRGTKAKTRKHSVPAWAHHGTEAGGACGGGKKGMTTSDILTTQASAEEQLLGIQKLIMNYNRMLDLQPQSFLEALFRAVKLNGLEVVKILVQLVTRKGIKLSSDAMREPESSATVLHVALLYNHADIVDYLIGLKDRDLILAVYNNAEYRNQTALHVAVANGNHSLVQKLLAGLSHRRDRKLLMNTVADGDYFRRKHLDGQLCVTAAAWAGSGQMLVTLARHGAHFGLKNLNGDTLLHRLVQSSAQLPDKMDYRQMLDATFEAVGECAGRRKYSTVNADQKALEQTQKQLSTFQKLLSIHNHNGLTPLALSARLGSVMLALFINQEKIFKIPQTKLGSISWVTYDVTDITSFAHDSYNKFSVLHILAHHSGKLSKSVDLDEDPDHSFLDIEPIKSLIDMKWSVYRWIYIAWCMLHSVYIILFTYFTYNANSCEHEHVLMDGEKYNHAQPVYYSLGVFLILPMLYILLELLDVIGICPYSICQMYNMSLLDKIVERARSEWVITGNGPYRFVAIGFSAFTIAWYVLYCCQNNNQDIMLSMAVLFGWIFVLFFTRGCRVTSKFSIMIQKMFFRDLMYFLAVYMVILLAFSFSVNVMYSQFHMGHGMLHIIFYKMMNIITDLDEKAPLEEARHPLFTKMMLIFYAIVAVILLMNMLIAMMNTSYETVRSTRCNLWKQQQLSILLMIERRVCLWCPILARLSERDIWHKQWDDQLRSYLDVTTGQ